DFKFLSSISSTKPDSSFSLKQACTANLQACSKVDTTRVQACSKLTQSSKSSRGELAASLPRQTHCKHSTNSVRTQPRIRARGQALGKRKL
ncbi:hypothetical protein AVEN_178189-1, partial [Araneus ventricosus]